MRKKPRYRHTTDQRRRRYGSTSTGVGIAVGGAMAAALISMGTASADNTPPDPFVEWVEWLGHPSDAHLAAAQAADRLLDAEPPAGYPTLAADFDQRITLTPTSINDAGRDPFTELLPANATHFQILDAYLADNDLNSSIGSASLAQSLYQQIAAGTSSTAKLPDNHPFTDILYDYHLHEYNDISAAEFGKADAADQALAKAESTLPDHNLAGDIQTQILDAQQPANWSDPFELLLPANATDYQIAIATLDDEYGSMMPANLDSQIQVVLAVNELFHPPFPAVFGAIPLPW